MDFLEDLNCPMYINFLSELEKNEDSVTDVEASSCSAKEASHNDMEAESMDSDNNSNCEISNIGDTNSTLSESCNDDKRCLESLREHHDVYSECSADLADFSVNQAENLSLPEANLKKKTKKNTSGTKYFQLTEAKKRKWEDNYIPLAEQVVAFHKKTPQRFHTTGPKAFEPMKHWSPQITCPKSPDLRAAKRQRRIDAISREEQEEKEIEEMKRYKFRAQPVKPNILHNPKLPKVKRKSLTKAKSLQLRTAQRAAELYGRKKDDEKPFEFHARPVPKSILQGPTGLKEKPVLHVTEPKTPNFALKSREQKWKSEDKMHQYAVETQKFKAAPIPAPSSPFVVKYEKKRTEIEPFSFDIKDKERFSKKEKKIAEIIEKENKVFAFKAQPVPLPAPSALPPVPKKQLTVPQPFSFLLEDRGSEHSFNCTIEQKPPTFKAQPATVLEKPPFVPEKPPKQPVEIKEFHLHTDVRAEERKKLKEINDIKEHEKELALQRLKEIEEKQIQEEIMRIRKETVHKANPIRQYKPVEIKPASRPLTVPISPKFHTDERLHSRDQV